MFIYHYGDVFYTYGTSFVIKNDLVMLKVSRACMYITKQYIYMDICTYLSIDTGSSNIRILIKLVNRFS